MPQPEHQPNWIIEVAILLTGATFAWSLLGFKHFAIFLGIVVAAGVLSALVSFTLEDARDPFDVEKDDEE